MRPPKIIVIAVISVLFTSCGGLNSKSSTNEQLLSFILKRSAIDERIDDNCNAGDYPMLRQQIDNDEEYKQVQNLIKKTMNAEDIKTNIIADLNMRMNRAQIEALFNFYKSATWTKITERSRNLYKKDGSIEFKKMGKDESEGKSDISEKRRQLLESIVYNSIDYQEVESALENNINSMKKNNPKEYERFKPKIDSSIEMKKLSTTIMLFNYFNYATKEMSEEELQSYELFQRKSEFVMLRTSYLKVLNQYLILLGQEIAKAKANNP